jgi:hypothetical protein
MKKREPAVSTVCHNAESDEATVIMAGVMTRPLPGAIAIALVAAAVAFASPEYGRKTGKDCNYCHPPGNYQLKGAGKYYQEHKSLKGYVPPVKPDANSRGAPPAPPAEKPSGRS